MDKYQEALERAKKGLPIDEVFPELKESKDERIRKELIQLLSKMTDGIVENYTPIPLRDFVAYLEKQKEPLTPEEKMNHPLYLEGFDVGKKVGECVKEQKPVMIQWTGKNLKEVIDFTGKSPKFGEWFKSWEDFENYVHSHDDILKWIVKTADGYNIPSSFRFIQKPAEWSEEEIVNWLKENFHVSSFDNTKIVTKFSSMDELVKSMRKRLKSLRPQPHWKPSQEQMASLMRTITWLVEKGNHTDSSILADLRRELKKQI